MAVHVKAIIDNGKPIAVSNVNDFAVRLPWAHGDSPWDPIYYWVGPAPAKQDIKRALRQLRRDLAKAARK